MNLSRISEKQDSHTIFKHVQGQTGQIFNSLFVQQSLEYNLLNTGGAYSSSRLIIATQKTLRCDIKQYESELYDHKAFFTGLIKQL